MDVLIFLFWFNVILLGFTSFGAIVLKGSNFSDEFAGASIIVLIELIIIIGGMTKVVQ